MGEVIDFQKNQPHLSGEAECLACKYKWVAVAPVGVTQLECPECGLHKGVYRNLCLPEDKLFWNCKCGCTMFYITPTHAYCGLCGLAQEF